MSRPEWNRAHLERIAKELDKKPTGAGSYTVHYKGGTVQVIERKDVERVQSPKG